MPVTDRQQATQYLTALRSLLSSQYEEMVGIAAVDLHPNGSVAGIFSTNKKELYDFSITDTEIRYKLRPSPKRLDNKTVAYLKELSDLPMPLADDAYSMGFLQVWHRDTSRKNPPNCTVGTRCKGGCIAKGEECRVEVRSPITKKKVTDLVKAGKTIHQLGGSDLLVPLLGAAAIGLVGFTAGVTVGSYMGSQATAKPAVSRSQTVVAEKKPRKSRFKPESIPDPWVD